ncbi:MAG: hypothetical protein HY319_31610 [Armatimonadetes bacterium]|nr:hypothetical protein [Armatimonadota bacterium]
MRVVKTLQIAAILWLTAALPAWAQDVAVGGQVIMRLETAEQAEAVTRKIEGLLEAGANPAGIRVGKVDKQPTVVWGDRILVQVTPALAAANQSTPPALATLWVSRLRSAVGAGLLSLQPNRVVVPVGGEQRVELRGVAEGEIYAVDPANLAEVFQGEGPDELRIQGRAVGKTRITIQRGKGKAVLFVHVKDWAGYPPAEVDVKVNGDPAPGRMVAEAALRAARAQTRVNPGCRLIFDGELPEVPSVPTGETMKFSLPIRIEGSEDYYPVARKLPVTVTSLDLKPVESNLLLVSNRPEMVDQDGILLSYSFSRKEPCRLMYSHMNASPADRNLWVNLRNPSRQPVSVLVGWTHAGPNRNEVHTGHVAALRFLESIGSNVGFAITIPPGRQVELAEHVMGRRDLVSGFVNLRILEGEECRVEVRTAATPSRNDGSELPHLGGPFNPFKIHPHGVFAQPFFEEWFDYQVGQQQPLQLMYGESPWLIDFETGLPNTGNFGVLYRYHVALANPTARAVTVGLFFVPEAGPAASSVLVNGELRDAQFQRKGVATLVERFELPPGAQLETDLVTFPEASSNYPAYLELRELTAEDAVSREGAR